MSGRRRELEAATEIAGEDAQALPRAVGGRSVLTSKRVVERVGGLADCGTLGIPVGPRGSARPHPLHVRYPLLEDAIEGTGPAHGYEGVVQRLPERRVVAPDHPGKRLIGDVRR